MSSPFEVVVRVRPTPWHSSVRQLQWTVTAQCTAALHSSRLGPRHGRLIQSKPQTSICVTQPPRVSQATAQPPLQLPLVGGISVPEAGPPVNGQCAKNLGSRGPAWIHKLIIHSLSSIPHCCRPPPARISAKAGAAVCAAV
jgi:hypothetical protein